LGYVKLAENTDTAVVALIAAEFADWHSAVKRVSETQICSTALCGSCEKHLAAVETLFVEFTIRAFLSTAV
jgi:hypothetical protein